MQFRMLPSLDRTLPEYVMPQENNFPLTLCADFHLFSFLSWIPIVGLIKFNHKCMHNHLRPNIYLKVGERYIFMKSIFFFFIYVQFH